MPVAAFAPARLHYDYPEWTAPASGSTDTGKAWAWNHATAKYEPASFLLAAAVSAFGLTLIDDADAATARETLGLGTMATATETSYLLADGSRTGASSQAQTFTNGIVGPSWKPASDSTTALQLQNAAGTAVVTVDTTGQKLVIPAPSGDSLISFVEDSTWSIGQRADSFRIGRAANVATSTFVLTAAGYLGINTAGPGAQLHVVGTGTATGNNDVIRAGASFSVSYFSMGYLYDGASMTAAYMRASGSLPIALGTTSNIADGGAFRVTDDGVCALGSGNTSPTAFADIAAGTTARASLRIRSGTAPTSPNAGDIWFDGTHFYGYTGSATVQLDN